MKLNRRQIAGGACILVGTVAYLWLMAAEVVPTAVDLAAAVSFAYRVWVDNGSCTPRFIISETANCCASNKSTNSFIALT